MAGPVANAGPTTPPAPIPVPRTTPATVPPGAATAGDGSYERWTPATALPPAERAVLHEVRQWRYRRGGHLAYDWRLARAAERMLPWAGDYAGQTFPLEQLRSAAWAQGWTDGELAAVAVNAPPAELPAALRRQLRATLGNDAELDRVGVAVVANEAEARPRDENQHAAGDGPERQTAVVAFSRRLVHLAPVARRVAPGDDIALSGRLERAATHGVTVVARRPDGTLLRRAVVRDGRRLSAHVPAGSSAGTLMLQLLVERGGGPEVAAFFPVQVGDAPATAAAGVDEVDDATDAAATQGHHGSLLALLYGLRAAHDLPLPVPVPSLMRVARAHAEDMASHHFFAHASRRTGTVVDRLARVHQPFDHVVENIAEGPGPDQVFAQWLRSPGHRLNLLDPHVDAVGVAAVPGGVAAPTVAVLVMAALRNGR